MGRGNAQGRPRGLLGTCLALTALLTPAFGLTGCELFKRPADADEWGPYRDELVKRALAVMQGRSVAQRFGLDDTEVQEVAGCAADEGVGFLNQTTCRRVQAFSALESRSRYLSQAEHAGIARNRV